MLHVLKECNTQIELVLCEAGSEQWEKHGGQTYIPEETQKIMDESDACYKGPTTTIPSPDAPRSVAVSPRQKFELYANVRPIKTYTRLSPDKKLDFVCFREATEGLYAGIEINLSDDSAIAIRKTTRKGCKSIVDAAFDWAKKNNANISIIKDPLKAANSADCIMTDKWISMGDKINKKKKKKALRPYQVNIKIMKKANIDSIFMHCLPARWGEEVTNEVIDGKQSAVWLEALNRIHVQKSIIEWCLND